MEIDMMSHPFNYENHHRRKPRVSSRSSPREIRDRFYQSRSADQFDEPQNFHQNHPNVKHEVASNYGDDDDKVEDEPAEDLRRKIDD